MSHKDHSGQPLVAIAREDVNAATALHEAAHAIAYINVGLDFQHISVENAKLTPYPRMMDGWTKAVTAMAGPACEGIMFNHGRGTDSDVLEFIHRCHRESVEFLEDDPDAAEPDDYTGAGPYALAALPIALAIVTSNWADIERIARAALTSAKTNLPYAEIISVIDNKWPPISVEEAQRWMEAAEGHQEVCS